MTAHAKEARERKKTAATGTCWSFEVIENRARSFTVIIVIIMDEISPV